MSAPRILPALLLLALASPGARAAEALDACAGYIDSLPAVVGTQGVWCLRKDLATGLSSGAAITLGTNNVTIDCNGFKLGGLLAGPGTATTGILAIDRANAVVRNCNVRGFLAGIDLRGDASSAGHRVEGNRLDGNTGLGIRADGDQVSVRDNWVRDTGGSTLVMGATAIVVGDGEAVGNRVSGVAPATGNVVGLMLLRGQARDNHVAGLVPAGGLVIGLFAECAGECLVAGNDVVGADLGTGTGITCSNRTVARDNIASGFPQPFGPSCTGPGNEAVP